MLRFPQNSFFQTKTIKNVNILFVTAVSESYKQNGYGLKSQRISCTTVGERPQNEYRVVFSRLSENQ